MGRLTLNMLLSFAQFEREIAGERVRDKKLAMTKKGMWVNGRPPHGYKVEKCILSPDPKLKEEVLLIFEKYLELESMLKLQAWLTESGYSTRSGKSWQKGALYNMLANRVYLGKLPYKNEEFDGNHEAIIPKTLFDKVQDLLRGNNRSHKLKSRAKDHSLLAGLLYGVDGQKYYPSHSKKKMATPRDGGSIAGAQGCAERCKRYRYYLSKEVSKHQKIRLNPLAQIPAQEIEEYVQAITPAIIRDEKYLEAFPLQGQMQIQEKLQKAKLTNRETLLKIYHKIVVSSNSIELHINQAGIFNLIYEMAYNTEGAFAGEETDIITKAIQLKKVNHGASVIRGEIIASGANPQMKETIRKSFAYNRQLLNGRTLPSMEVRHLGRPVLGNHTSLKELCEAQNLDLRHTRRILNLRFLAGDILQKILTDRVPQHWTMGALFEAASIAHPVRGGTSASVPQASTKTDWAEQRALLNR